MNEKAIAEKVAKSVTATYQKIKKTYREDRDGYEEVDIMVNIDVRSLEATELVKLIERNITLINSERRILIRKYSMVTDPLQPVMASTRMRTGELQISGGFATDIGVLPRGALEKEGFRQEN